MEHRRLLHTDFDVLNKIAEETNHTVAQVALNWLLSRPTITSLVIGARTEDHLITLRARRKLHNRFDAGVRSESGSGIQADVLAAR